MSPIRHDTDECYRVLGLPPGASPVEVRSAHRDLVKIYHPDRFVHDPQLQEKAQQKLKEINHAYEVLKATGFPPRMVSAAPNSRPAGTSATGPRREDSRGPSVSPPSSSPPDSAKRFFGGRSVWAWVTLGAIAVFLRVILSQQSGRVDRSSSPSSHVLQPRIPMPLEPNSAPDTARAATVQHLSGIETSKSVPGGGSSQYQVQRGDTLYRIAQAFGMTVQELRSANGLDGRHRVRVGDRLLVGTAGPNPQRQSGGVATSQDESRLIDQLPQEVSEKPQMSAPRADAPGGEASRPTADSTTAEITVGSTKDTVLAIQGTPTRFDDQVWYYGTSSIVFDGDRVINWDSSPLEPLRVRMLPKTPNPTPASYFTIGSTKDQVLMVQGTPTRFDNHVWHYGTSGVTFADDRVITWDSSPLDPLRVKMLPEDPTRAPGTYFTIGSTKDEVLLIQGTPTRFNNQVWYYGTSSVTFRELRVVGWDSSPLDPLRVKMKSSESDQ